MKSNIKMSKEKRFSVKKISTSELVQICMSNDKSGLLDKLTAWREKYQQKQAGEGLKFTLAEWFCIGWAGYQTLLDRKYGTKRQQLIEALITGKICSLTQLGAIFGKKNNLFRRGILEETEDGIRLNSRSFNSMFGFILTNDLGPASKPAPKKVSEKSSATGNFTVPLDLARRVKQYVVGQDEAVAALCAAVYEHFVRVQTPACESKNNVLLLGPTGTGKTFLCNTVAKLLGVPFLDVNITQYSKAGYVGDEVSDILRSLRDKVPYIQNNIFPFSIVYIDEIDKLRSWNEKERDISGRGVQEELLKLLESAEYTCSLGRHSSRQTYDISRVLFVAGGAFVGLDDIAAKRANAGRIGFAASKTKPPYISFQTQDLEEYGLLPELVGRFGVRVALKPLTEGDLMSVLTNGKNNVLAQYKRMFAHAGISLTVPKQTLTEIARRGCSYKTGARGLKNVLSGLLGPALLAAKKAGKKRFVLTPQLLEEK